MNRKQKLLLLCGIGLAVIAGLYPPWRFVLHGPDGMSGARSVGHSFSAPRYADYYYASPLQEVACSGYNQPTSDGKRYQRNADGFYGVNSKLIEAKVDFQILAVEWVTLVLVVVGLLCVLKSPPGAN